MKRVLLTGASGFVGAHVLCGLLEQTDHTFVCLSSWRHRGTPTRISHDSRYQVHQDRVRIVTHDLQGTVPDLGVFDIILNIASESHVDRSIKEPVAFIENNVKLVLNMLEYARKYPPELFLQFSTDEVYGPSTNDVSEWRVLLPSNPYAASKAAQEMIAISYWRTYGVPLVLTNTNNIVGPGQDVEKFVPKIIKTLQDGNTLTIHTNNGVLGKRFYTPVENVTSAINFIMRLDLPKENRPSRFHIGGGKELNNLQMAQLLSEYLGKDLEYGLMEVGGIRPGYDQNYAEAGDSLQRLGWKPPVRLEDALKEIVRLENNEV